MENLYYNGINIIDLAKRRKHQIYVVVSAQLRSLELQGPRPPLAPPCPVPPVPACPSRSARPHGEWPEMQGLGQREVPAGRSSAGCLGAPPFWLCVVGRLRECQAHRANMRLFISWGKGRNTARDPVKASLLIPKTGRCEGDVRLLGCASWGPGCLELCPQLAHPVERGVPFAGALMLVPSAAVGLSVSPSSPTGVAPCRFLLCGLVSTHRG